MMKTIVLRKNQLVLFSVIRFYSQRGLGGNLKMEMPLCLEWVGKEMKRKRDSLHGKTPSPTVRTPFNHVCMCLTNRCRVCAECNKTRPKWVIVFQPNNYGDVGGTHRTSSLTSRPQSSLMVGEILNWSLLTFSQTAVL